MLRDHLIKRFTDTTMLINSSDLVLKNSEVFEHNSQSKTQTETIMLRENDIVKIYVARVGLFSSYITSLHASIVMANPCASIIVV